MQSYKCFVLLLCGCVCFSSLMGQAIRDKVLSPIKGVVLDDQFYEPLPFATIIELSTGKGSYTDDKGHFEILLDSKVDSLIEISFVGYETKRILPSTLAVSDTIYLHLSPIVSKDIIVTASRKAQNTGLAAASVDVVGAMDIKSRANRTFDQAIEGLNGLSVTRSSGANIQAVSIRGSSDVAGGGVGNRVLLLIDGRPAISPESGGALWNLVPLQSIERIEVVKGAYSSLFGSSAMGGVINVITKKPDQNTETSIFGEYGIYQPLPKETGYPGYHDFYTIGLNRSGHKGKFSYLFDIGRSANDGHRQKSSFSMWNVFTKLKYHLSNRRDIQFSMNFNSIDNDTPATWLSAFDKYKVAEYRMDDYQSRRESNFDLYYQSISGKDTRYSTRFYYYTNQSKFTFDDNPDNDTTNINIIHGQWVPHESIAASRVGNVSQVDWSASKSHFLIGGLEFQYDIISGKPDSLLYGDHNALNIGIFAQDEISLSEKWTATIGVRQDYYMIVNQFSEYNFSPKLSTIYLWRKGISSRFLLAQAFRTPSIAERFIKYEQGGGIRFVPNPDLRSEKLDLSVEAGQKWRFNDFIDADVSFFYNHYTNLISYQYVPNENNALIYRVINLAKAVMQGIEVKIDARLSHDLKVSLGYTLLDAKDVSENRLNDVLPYKHRHSMFVDIRKKWKKFSLAISGRYKSAIQEVFIYKGSEPHAFSTINMVCTYQWNKNMTARFSIKNIFDASYQEIERYQMPNRNFSLGFQINLNKK